MKTKDKVLIGITVLLFCVLFAKSLFFDEARPLNKEEEKFKQFVEKRIEDGKENLGLFNRTGLATFKVIKIEKIDEKGQTEVLYIDETKNKYVEGIIQGRYKAKVRGYLFFIFPYKEFSVEGMPS